ncbi:hypothetical protein GCM10011491_41310 [Brucella endophytica]|uniref:Uncharacterized protein n=1 Tax=Brucella endophytica TaxID=1963359 RepID=A0A916SQV2_9HYPH|nr:hypothetical protein GCM10011491_41310 [Brucella endophytica]
MPWNPRPEPKPDWTPEQRADYHAGYSDAHYGHPFGSGHDGSRSRATYRQGFDDAKADSSSK